MPERHMAGWLALRYRNDARVPHLIYLQHLLSRNRGVDFTKKTIN
jgi:hypothetical protein